MIKNLLPGTWRGLVRTSNMNDIFTIVAFDQRSSYQKMLPGNIAFADAVQIKSDVVRALSADASAMLLDPEYGLQPALELNRHCGLLLAVEKSGYTGDSSYRRTEMYDRWHVGTIKQFGTDAVKLLVYYHPEAGKLAEEIELLCQDIAQQCRASDIAFFLEPVLYSIDNSLPKNSPEFAKKRPQLVKETARKLGQCGAHILKLEFPIDAAHNDNYEEWVQACKQVSNAASVPWVLLSAGVDYEIFAEQVKAACQGGASGFLGGRAIWKECVTMTATERQVFLEGIAVQRLKHLIDISNTYARPWTDFYQTITIQAGWYNRYNS